MVPVSPSSATSDAAPVPLASKPPGSFRRVWNSLLSQRYGAVATTLALFLAVHTGVRLSLAIASFEQIAWNLSLLAAFAFGFMFDLAAGLLCTAPLALLLALVPRRVFNHAITRVAAHAFFLAVIFGLLFGAVAEWLFWDEFGVRFNFIAVDYLVYTTEVIGNIRESYPMGWIYTGLAVASALVGWLLHRTGWIRQWLQGAATDTRASWRGATFVLGLAVLTGTLLSEASLPGFANNYNREIGKNGTWSLFAAFRANQLDFERFYPTMPTEAAFRRTRRMLGVETATGGEVPRDLLRPVVNPGPEQRWNIIQITVESLSAEFLTRYGGPGITPNLDALASRSLIFDQLYATGTRTDRGMEALTLSVPPTPGRSLVKRPDNAGLFTLGSVLRSKGYDTAFIYGGFGYFDNMNAFFGGNGYRVLDRQAVPKSDISFANVWGACDEDLFRWVLREADQGHASGRPFYHFVMTTSNHRPFTYPAGRIDLPPQTSGRAGGVKYTDFAIGEFLRAAESHPWFKNTVFVIVADHCASSAGKSELPVQNYHIPCLIYAPGGQIPPGVIKTVSSQVDIAPTLLGILGWSYPSRFYGRDARHAPEAEGRAFIGTYQKLGLYRGGQLAVLQPAAPPKVFAYDQATSALRPTAPVPDLVDDAIAAYQTACWVFKHHAQTAVAPTSP